MLTKLYFQYQQSNFHYKISGENKIHMNFQVSRRLLGFYDSAFQTSVPWIILVFSLRFHVVFMLRVTMSQLVLLISTAAKTLSCYSMHMIATWCICVVNPPPQFNWQWFVRDLELHCAKVTASTFSDKSFLILPWTAMLFAPLKI